MCVGGGLVVLVLLLLVLVLMFVLALFVVVLVEVVVLVVLVLVLLLSLFPVWVWALMWCCSLYSPWLQDKLQYFWSGRCEYRTPVQQANAHQKCRLVSVGKHKELAASLGQHFQKRCPMMYSRYDLVSLDHMA